MAAGDFTASQMADIVVAQREMWNNPRTNRILKRPVESGKALLENQQVQIIPIMQGNRCISVKCVFLKNELSGVNDASITAQSCEFGGDEAESGSVQYDPNIHIWKDFVVSNEECKDTFTFEDKVARQLNHWLMEMDADLNERVIAFLQANAATNKYSGFGTNVGTVTNIENSFWNEDLLGQFKLITEMNDIQMPIMLDGTNFYVHKYLANFDALNDDERDKAAKYRAWADWYFDPRNIDTVVGSQASFLFEPGAAAFWSKNENESQNPVPFGDNNGTQKWRIRSNNYQYNNNGTLTPVFYDVYSQSKCTMANGVMRVKTHFRLQFQGGIILAPTANGYDTGILQFNKVADVV